MNIRVVNDSIGRSLHDTLYERMYRFCQQYTPEVPAEDVVNHWLGRLYGGDDNLHILVTLDDKYRITGHCIIDIQNIHGKKIIFCHQAMGDRNNIPHISEGIEYIDKLAAEINAYCCVINTAKHIKVLEKKFNFNLTRSVLIKNYEGSEYDL